MPSLYSPAQVLPLLIIESIASYMPMLPNVMLPMMNGLWSKVKQPSLLPLMGTCRQWRSIVCPLFYCSALLEFDGNKEFHKKNTSVIRLSDVIATGNQKHIRQLQISINTLGFADTEKAIKNIKAALDQGGPLHTTHEVTLLVDCRSTSYHPYTFQESEDTGFDTELVDATLAQYAQLFDKLLPNRRIMSMHRARPLCYLSETNKAVYAQVNLFIHNLLGTALGHLSLHQFSVTKPIVKQLGASALRRISIAHHKGSQQHLELIRRNYKCLEFLRIDHATSHAIEKLTWLEKKAGTLVYPQLKKLHISSCSGRRNIAHSHHNQDPFPALEVLACRGHFPFSSPLILQQGRSHIRVLKIDMDHELMSILDEHKVLAPGSFEVLDVVILGWSVRNNAPVSDHANALFLKTLSIAASPQQVLIHNLHIYDVEASLLSKVNFTNPLQVLDLEGTTLTMAQAIKLLCGFKRLDRANLCIKDDTVQHTTRMPMANEIQEYQAQFKGYSSSVRLLGIDRAYYTNSRRKAEYIVLMTSILTSVQIVHIGGVNISRADSILGRISLVLKRSMYKDCDQVKSVKYSIGSF
ncbi:hypothetical protein LPJ66_005633 [Kickxella alabastrina]|uniref:Uncharacterized protein n=1 Tax=Kickxella alabastrina TaxID=61397 RepID=A0ACC1IFC4_9FUNG|nr:hypothetical protein LPJ66_005633 [Kickxella alabastrina]